MEQRDSASVRTGQINQAREREQRAAATAAAPPRAVAVARQPGLNASLEGHGDSSSAATHGEESSPPGDRAIGPAKRSAPAPEPEPAPERELSTTEYVVSARTVSAVGAQVDAINMCAKTAAGHSMA